MSLHNYEFHHFNDLCRKIRNIVDKSLADSVTYQRILGYIAIANNNLDKFHKAICDINPYYKDCLPKELYFNLESLLSTEKEICFVYETADGIRLQKIDIGSFIIFLAKAGLIED